MTSDLVGYVTARHEFFQTEFSSTPRGPPAEAELTDARSLAIQLDRQGEPRWRYNKAVQCFVEDTAAGWEVGGPRTCKYWCSDIGNIDLPPLARSQRWRIDNGLADNDAGSLEHQFLSELMRTAICMDHLDVYNLQTFEREVRKLQVREEIQRLKEEERRQDVGAGASALTCEYFSGRASITDGADATLLLISYVSKKVPEEAELLKQQRKASEARQHNKW